MLYAFQGGNDGAWPIAGLVRSNSGDFYGTTSAGGGTGCGGAGCGTVFRLKGNKEAVLYSFEGGNDGAYPNAALTVGKGGKLFGTTYQGGGANCSGYGCGTIFELATEGTETVLYSFRSGSDGAYPYSSLIADAAGNLYGTTAWGGAYDRGTVFKLTPAGTETVLYAFTPDGDGNHPYGGVIEDSGGNLYGTTYRGGYAVGTVFKLAPDGTESLMHDFRRRNDGTDPYAAMIMDSEGNLYGSTVEGGSTNCTGFGCGTVFKLEPDGTETIYPLDGPGGGSQPFGGVALDDAGNLYGTTNIGGADGLGVVFQMSPQGAETLLHTFKGGRDGSCPYDGVITDKKGNLYGTTAFGGNGAGCSDTGCGIVFEVQP